MALMFEHPYWKPNADEIVPKVKELCEKGKLDLKTAQAYWWLMNYYRHTLDSVNQAKYENEGKKMILKFLSIPEEDGFPVGPEEEDYPMGGSGIIYLMDAYYEDCAKWEEVISLCDYALEKFYPSHPKSLERDSGNKDKINTVYLIYVSRAEAHKNLGLLENAKRDFEKALKEFQGYMASNAPKSYPQEHYLRIQEHTRLHLAETLENLCEKELAYKAYRTIKENLEKADTHLFGNDQKRFEAALERAGITSPTLELKSLHEE